MRDEGPLTWRCRDRVVEFGQRTVVMGVLNVTPDSFSDGGRYLDREKAVAHAVEMVSAGADIIDIGGESSRPGAARISAKEEMDRILPVVAETVRQVSALVSVDTTKAEVARKALEAGAHIVNDISALRWDAEMPEVVRESGAGTVLMHMQGTPETMQQAPRYDDVVTEVRGFLQERITFCGRNGIAFENIAIDPGIGFGKELEHNLDLLRQLHLLAELGRPVIVGVSRKSLLGLLTGRPVDQRLAGSLAAASYAVMHGAHILRVHDVAETRDALRVIEALCEVERSCR